MSDKTVDTIKYLNTCIQEYSSKIEWGRIIYSLAGWAEYFATDEYDCEVSNYAPQMIQRLEILKEYISEGKAPFEADIDVLIKEFGLNLEEAKIHLEMMPYLE